MIKNTLKCGRVVVGCLAWNVAGLSANDSAQPVAAPEAPQLFVATLRPGVDAPESTAYGTATLLLHAGPTRASVSVSYSNLSSPIVSSHLKLGHPNEDGRHVKSFYGATQPVQFDWGFEPAGAWSAGDLQQALADGSIFVSIATNAHPVGELRGQFIRAAGSKIFVPPPAPPAFSPQPLAASDAARFLTQATFGPKKAEIDRLMAIGLEHWLDEQMRMPATSLLDATRADFAAFPPTKGKQEIRPINVQAAWWKNAVTAPDQLRQRVAFALSEILVVSDRNGMLRNHADGLARYYDLLAREAFGNYRQLLENVTLSPVMGTYLSSLRDTKGNPERGTSADENYARELMQLFTIGLNELQPDGTYQLGADGLPIPTYSQQTVAETARVFTGWAFASPGRRRNFRARPDFAQPMMLYPEHHDDGAKTIVGDLQLPAKQGGRRDLEMTLDALCNHPNTGPYLCRQLIQRLVSSNPSPGYVYRVSEIFASDGLGRRGNLGAVVRAILLDYEARSPALINQIGHGKLKEPLIQATALLRAFDGVAANGRYHLPKADDALGQTALHSPTVFNFFGPDYVMPGPLAAAGLRAPEYQILTATTAITVPNFLRALISTRQPAREDQIVLELAPLVALADSPRELVDYCDLIFCAGSMSSASRTKIADALAALPRRADPIARARCALDLTVTSADAAIQR